MENENIGNNNSHDENDPDLHTENNQSKTPENTETESAVKTDENHREIIIEDEEVLSVKEKLKNKNSTQHVTISIDKRKIRKYSVTAGITAGFLLMFFLLAGFFAPEKYVVIKMLNGDIYRGKVILLTDSRLYYQKGKDVFDDFEIAYSEKLDFDISFSVERTDEIESIHYVLRSQKDEVAETEETKKPDEKYDTNIFGTYHIFLSGHEGTLYVRYKNGRVYGGVKFPNWANGVYEPLKDMKIQNGTLSFTRSATTLKDIRRIGISSYFTQTFTGQLYPKTGEIKGFFINSGAKQSWHAVKIK